MKFILPLSAAIVITASSFVANDCAMFEQFTTGTQYTTTNYDAKGKVSSTVECTTQKVTAEGEKTTAEIAAISKDKDGKQTSSANYTITCTPTSYLMDLKGMAVAAAGSNPQAKDMDLTIEGDMLDYPTTIAEGQTLPNGQVIMKMSKDGSVMSTTTIKIHDRKCEKKESKTTAAGTWDCYKITYITDGVMNMNFGGMSKEFPIAPR